MLSKFSACDHVPDVVDVGGSRIYRDHYGKVLAAKMAVRFNGVPEHVPATQLRRAPLWKRIIPPLDWMFS